MKLLRELRVLEDVTTRFAPDEGFLRLTRLRLQNVYEDGSSSAPYPCDVVSRVNRDAVAVVLWDRRGPGGNARVLLREAARPPVGLRPDGDGRGLLAEIVAGMIEPGDAIDGRAAAEAWEEAGIRVGVDAVAELGGPHYPSPGTADERVHFRAIEHDLDDRAPPPGDGSVMEEAARLLVLPLTEALARCRDGSVPDMKTEIGLARLEARLR